MSIEIICGDARSALAGMPEQSVQTCVTSPPFYSLRDYHVPPSVWGGASECAHEWTEWEEQHDEREDVAHAKTRTTDRCWGDASRRFDGNHQKHRAGSFCRLCGAWLGCLGLDPTPGLYVAHLVDVFAAVHRVLHPSGTVWLNLGDSFAGSWGNQGRKEGRGTQRPINGPMMQNIAAGYPSREHNTGAVPPGLKHKDLMMLPHRAAMALQEWGWWVRSTIVWAKSNPMPESVSDRPTQSHDYIFLLAKNASYYYDADAIREPHTMRVQRRPSGHKRRRPGPLLPEHTWSGTARDEPGFDGHPAGRNKRSVWTINTEPYEEAHFATFPQKLVEPCILAGTSEAGCCARCGAPWQRVVEHGVPERMGGHAGVSHGHADGPMARGGKGQWDEGHMPVVRPVRTVGWQPGCPCQAGPAVPCRVLDPFCGSGTTLLVAKRLGRTGVGIDLNPEYCRLAERRCASIPYALFSAAGSGSDSGAAC